MNLDLTTLIVATMVATFALAFALLLVDAQTRNHDGLAAWGWSLLSLGFTGLSFGMRLEGLEIVTVALATLFFTGGLALQLLAIARFQRGRARDIPLHFAWVPVALGVALAIALAGWTQMRYFWLSVVYAAQLALIAWCAWGPRLQGPRESARLVVVIGAGGLAIFFLARSGLVMMADHGTASASIPVDVAGSTFFAALAGVLMSTAGFLLMQKERALELFRDQSTHDPLTGVANRRSLLQQLDTYLSLANRQSNSLAFLMIDIDHFKRVNDTYGNLAGDAVLREVAKRIRQRLRRQDVVGRYGGEEFGAVLSTDVNGALVVANEIRDAFRERPVDFGGRKIGITVSIGIHSRVPEVVEGAADLMIEAAERALYIAKNRGRDRVEVSD